MRERFRVGRSTAGRTVVGVGIIVFGLLLMAGNLRWIRPDQVWLVWPALAVVVGVSRLASCETASGKAFGVILVVLGAWGLASAFVDLPIQLERWWPLFLIAAGVVLLMRSHDRDRAQAGDDGTTMSALAIWAGVKRRSVSPSFRRAEASVIMGGVDLDLRQAGAAEGGAVVDAFVMWGGITIRVPPDWAVVDHTVAIMGGTNDRTSPGPAPAHRLTIEGMVLMGGIEVRN